MTSYSEAVGSFSRLLHWHLVNGTRPSGHEKTRREWESQEFAGALRRGITDKSVRNWRTGRAVPRILDPIEQALFGDTPTGQLEVWRNELRTAYTIACGKDVESHLVKDNNSESAANVGSAGPAAETGFDFGREIDGAAESGASRIAERLCSQIHEIVAAHSDRDKTVRFIRLHLEGEIEDTEEWLGSSRQGAEEQKTKKKDTVGEVAAFAFTNIFYAREMADAKKKKRALSMMLGELNSMTPGPMNSQAIAEALSQLARFYLR